MVKQLEKSNKYFRDSFAELEEKYRKLQKNMIQRPAAGNVTSHSRKLSETRVLSFLSQGHCWIT
jgi:phage shock protein A